METIADVVLIPIGKEELISIQQLKEQLYIYKDRVLKIGAFTACSNVTGQMTAYHEIAKVMHAQQGYLLLRHLM